MKRQLSLPILLPIALRLSAPVFSDPAVIEAENFSGFNDVARKPIQSRSAPGCHGGKMITGLDRPGEWTSYAFNVDRAGDYAIRLACRGEQDASFRLRLTVSSVNGESVGELVPAFFGKGYG